MYRSFYMAESPSTVQAGDGNYAINRHYRVPYIQFWSADVEQTLPLQIVIGRQLHGSERDTPRYHHCTWSFQPVEHRRAIL